MKILHLTLLSMTLSFSASLMAQNAPMPLDSIHMFQALFDLQPQILSHAENQQFYNPLVGNYHIHSNGITSDKGHYFIGIQVPDESNIIPMPGTTQPEGKFYLNPPHADYKKLPKPFIPAIPPNHR